MPAYFHYYSNTLMSQQYMTSPNI